MLKKLTLLIGLLLLSPTLSRAEDLSTTVCPGAGCVTWNVGGSGSIAIQVTNTFVGTLTFQGTVDNTNYTSFRVVKVSDTASSGITTTTATGIFNGTTAGFNKIRVVFTAYTSGTATVTSKIATQAAKFNSSGGGSGTIGGSIADGQVAVGNGADTIGGSSAFVSDGVELQFVPAVAGGEAGITGKNTSDTADSSFVAFFGTTGDTADGGTRLTLNVHEGGANEASFDMVVAGDSGNAFPTTTLTAPGALTWVLGTGGGFNELAVRNAVGNNTDVGFMALSTEFGAYFQAGTDGDLNLGDAVYRLRVHENGADEAEFELLVDGGSGNATPDTTFTFPGDVLFNASETTINESVPGGIAKLNVINTSSTADASVELVGSTIGDSATGPVVLILNVHEDGADVAGFIISVDGASGNNTPDTTFTFPGAALFNGAPSYTFDAVVTADSFYSTAATSIASTSANSCGTTAPSLGTGSSNTSGSFTVGATSGTDCTLTFSVAATNRWTCGVSNTTTANLVRAVPSTTITTLFQGVFVAGDVIQYTCSAS